MRLGPLERETRLTISRKLVKIIKCLTILIVGKVAEQ